MTLTSPRLYHCRCQRRKTATFRPLNTLLTDGVAPELLLKVIVGTSILAFHREDEEETYTLRDPVVRSLERLTWSLWHGNVYKAFQKLTDLVMDLDVAVATVADGTARKLLKAVEEFYTYIERNRAFIPNYGEATGMGSASAPVSSSRLSTK
jgi:hypothetical protein